MVRCSCHIKCFCYSKSRQTKRESRKSEKCQHEKKRIKGKISWICVTKSVHTVQSNIEITFRLFFFLTISIFISLFLSFFISHILERTIFLFSTKTLPLLRCCYCHHRLWLLLLSNRRIRCTLSSHFCLVQLRTQVTIIWVGLVRHPYRQSSMRKKKKMLFYTWIVHAFNALSIK